MSIKIYASQAEKQAAYRQRKADAEREARDKRKIMWFFSFAVAYWFLISWLVK